MQCFLEAQLTQAADEHCRKCRSDEIGQNDDFQRRLNRSLHVGYGKRFLTVTAQYVEIMHEIISHTMEVDFDYTESVHYTLFCLYTYTTEADKFFSLFLFNSLN